MPRSQQNPAAQLPARMPAGANDPQAQQLNPAQAPPIRQQRNLTPVADRVPVVVAIPVRQLSGAAWCAQYPTSTSTADLISPFRENVDSFLAALRAAGASVSIAATLRPPNRAYLMHWSWKIVKANADPQSIPAREGVNIKWDHTNADGTYNSQASIAAAQAMVNTYGIRNLRVAPSLNSRHIDGNAIDMSISWADTLTITDASGVAVQITTEPRTGMNTDLHTVGAGYGVTKFSGGAADKPHWSNDGR